MEFKHRYFAWVDNAVPMPMGSSANPSAKYGISPYELLVKEGSETQTIQATSIALGCPPELDGETV